MAIGYKSFREEIVRTITVALECGWSPKDVGTVNPILLPTLRVRDESAPRGWRDTGVPVIEEPVSVDWAAWAAPTLGAVLHLSTLATRVIAPILTSGAAAGSTSATAAVDPDVLWAKHALTAALHFTYYILGGDASISSSIALPMLPLMLRTAAHPEKELSKLASIVASHVAHSLTLWRSTQREECADAAFYYAVDDLVAASLARPSAHKGSASGSSSMSVAASILAAFSVPLPLPAGTVDAHANCGAIISSFRGEGTSTPGSSSGGAGPWLMRRAALAFLTPLRSHHLIGLSHASDSILEELVEARLCDPQVEVQEFAGEAHIGVMMTLSHAAQARAATRFLALAVTRLPKRVEAPALVDDPSPEGLAATAAHRAYRAAHARALRLRHGGVQGVGAIVRAHPFDVPPFLPPVLSSLALRASDPNPVGGTVKKTIAEFRRTHHDAWEQHRGAFTEEQLADVLAVGAASTYFA